VKAHFGQVYNQSERGRPRGALPAHLLAAVLLLAGAGCNDDVEYLEPATDSTFERGQVWSYLTRPGEEGSLLIVGAVDRAPGLGRVVHIRVVDVVIETPLLAAGFANQIAHLALKEDALLQSVTEQVDAPWVTLGGFERGYDNWLDAYDAGTFFVQKVPLAEALDDVEASQNK
jgi:hypothetical protein